MERNNKNQSENKKNSKQKNNRYQKKSKIDPLKIPRKLTNFQLDQPKEKEKRLKLLTYGIKRKRGHYRNKNEVHENIMNNIC